MVEHFVLAERLAWLVLSARRHSGIAELEMLDLVVPSGGRNTWSCQGSIDERYSILRRASR